MTNATEPIIVNDRQVVVTDIQMPFGSMVIFMFKWALAAIPAALMLMIVVGAILIALMAVSSISTAAKRAAPTQAETPYEPVQPDDPNFKPQLPPSPLQRR